MEQVKFLYHKTYLKKELYGCKCLIALLLDNQISGTYLISRCHRHSLVTSRQTHLRWHQRQHPDFLLFRDRGIRVVMP